MNSLSDEIINSLKVLPSNPGVYQFMDSNGDIIYIGKAKNLKNRVQSYLRGQHEHFKTKVLVKSICKIDYHVVDSETDALLLENNLIKTHQPKYNVLLKDDKTYPWIEVIKEPFPRVQTTRNKTMRALGIPLQSQLYLRRLSIRRISKSRGGTPWSSSATRQHLWAP